MINVQVIDKEQHRRFPLWPDCHKLKQFAIEDDSCFARALTSALIFRWWSTMRHYSVALITVVLMGALAQIAHAAEPSYNWTDFYGGLNTGWMWGKANTSTSILAPAQTSFTESPATNGAIGGFQLGYNLPRIANWLVGIETDFQFTGADANGSPHQTSLLPPLLGATLTEQIARSDSLDWFGTVRGRLGYTVWSGVTLYATGGLAYGHIRESTPASFTQTIFTFPLFVATANTAFDSSATKTGWTAGGGIEGLVPNSHVSWKVEYLYINLAAANFNFNSVAFGVPVSNAMSIKFSENIIRVGLSWHLN